MNGFKKSLTVCFVVVLVFFLSSVKTWAYGVSAAEGCSVPNVHPDARGFLETIKSFPNWTEYYYREYFSCFEIQYTKMDYGGANNCFIDGGNIHYLVGHGAIRWDGYYGMNISAIIFEDGSSLVPGEAWGAWGDKDLEWIGFRNCKLLDNYSRNLWARTMNGLRLILGFKTNCYTHNSFGKIWAQKMRRTMKYDNNNGLAAVYPGQTVTQAWFSATDATQPGGTTACVIAETENNYEDHLWGEGYTNPNDPNWNSQKYFWCHTVPYAVLEDVNSLGAMKVYEVVPRDVDEQYVQSIGSAFGLVGNPVVDRCDSFVMADLSDSNNPRILEVSRMTGHFNYHEDGKLFAADSSMGQYPPVEAPGAAETFLTEHGLLPGDAGSAIVEYDTITKENIDTNEVLETHYRNTNVSYGRQIAADSRGTMVSVAGAGARLNVYIAEDGNVMGARGNWRNIQTSSEITVNNAATTWSFFNTYGQKVAIEPVLVKYDVATPNYVTAAQLYYEYSSHKRQTELIPCWMFEVDYSLDGQLVLTANTFIPAAQSYMPPVVEIDTSVTTSTTFNHGEIINFDCDVVAGFGTPPYAYIWESSVDGFLSTQKTFQTNLLSIHCPDESLDCSPMPHTITVTVTDAKGFQSTDAISITIAGPCDECSDPADLDGDGRVDLKDFAYWANRFLTQTGHQEQ